MSPLSCESRPMSWTPDCGGHGLCALNPNTGVPFCACNDGWTGNGDWTFNGVNGYDCQINKTAHKTLWIILVVVYVSIWLWALPKVREIYLKAAARAKLAKRSGGSGSIVKNRALLTMISELVFIMPLTLVLAVIELTSEYRVVVNAGPTIVFIFMRTFLYLQVQLFQPYLLKTILGKAGGQRANQLIITYDKRQSVIIGGIMSAGLLSLVPLGLGPGNPKAAVATYATYHIMVGFCMTGIFVQTLILKREITVALNASFSSLKKKSILRVRDNLIEAQTASMRQAGLQALVSFVLGCIPALWSLYAYFLPVTFTIPGIFFLKILKTMRAPESKSDSEDQQSSSFRKTNASTDPSSGGRRFFFNKNVLAVSKGKTATDKKSLQETKDLRSDVLSSVEGPGASRMDIAGFEGAEQVLSHMPSEHDSKESRHSLRSRVTELSYADDEEAMEILRKQSSPQAVVVKMSPAMKVLSSLTPSRKGKGKQAFFSDTGDDDDEDVVDVQKIADTPKNRK